MRTRQDVEKFLEEIRTKEACGLITFMFLNQREKNAQALLDLDIPPDKRKEVILQLKAEDFYRIEEGVYQEQYEMVAFGKIVKGIEVYIKISVTKRNVICISFHKAEHPIIYPFKD
ncbi:hypothetical protein PSM36_2513 [Proteiniphilum saccharofermentans]|uniref:Motility quorum-sensing regulator, toxin of MqsA n=1 Tax=Proteiniphilum saccharofermentans TaxID=1642647 RepID=A0A1R3TCI8_9BACT|nr:type II toxin-antitoxin system MqsR family toxin [Proteiniphilum saccharofermentans]SCD21314.1 hypothetical protein PSM36_2513 [Proteiniphilum saccharofermentans]